MKITCNDSHASSLFCFSLTHPVFSPLCTALETMNTAVQSQQERRFDSDFILFKLNEVPLTCFSLLLYFWVSSWWMEVSCLLQQLWLVSHRFFNLSASPLPSPSIRFSFSLLSLSLSCLILNIFLFSMMSVLTCSSTLYFKFFLLTWFGLFG